MVISSVVRHLVSVHLIHREDYFAIVQPVRTINASIPFVCLAPANAVYHKFMVHRSVQDTSSKLEIMYVICSIKQVEQTDTDCGSTSLTTSVL